MKQCCDTFTRTHTRSISIKQIKGLLKLVNFFSTQTRSLVSWLLIDLFFLIVTSTSRGCVISLRNK